MLSREVNRFLFIKQKLLRIITKLISDKYQLKLRRPHLMQHSLCATSQILQQPENNEPCPPKRRNRQIFENRFIALIDRYD